MSKDFPQGVWNFQNLHEAASHTVGARSVSYTAGVSPLATAGTSQGALKNDGRWSTHRYHPVAVSAGGPGHERLSTAPQGVLLSTQGRDPLT